MIIKEEHIVFLTITSWAGLALGARHYYGRLRPLEGDEREDVTYTMTKEDAFEFNRIEKVPECIGYEEGEKNARFSSEAAVIFAARKQFKVDFPKAKVLVLGDCAVCEPQRILVGPRDFKREINILSKARDRLDWDIKEDRPELEEISRQWQVLWPIKYI